MQYSYNAKQIGKDFILYNRLVLIDKLKINMGKTKKRWSYYLDASLNIIKGVQQCK